MHTVDPDRRLRVVAIDLGRVRLGLAVSDAQGRLASPRGVLARRGTRADVRTLADIAATEEAAAFVVGLPLEADGRAGPMASSCRRFAEALADATELPVFLVEEGGTSAEADATLRELGLSSARRRRQTDKVAAAAILDRFLQGADAERVRSTGGT